MFTFSRLGELGRFGNQLFQIAATIGLAIKHRHDYLFPEWPPSVYFRDPVPQTTAKFNADFIVGQRTFRFLDFAIATDAACTIDLRGYFQSERYFLHAQDVIRRHLAPHPTLVNQIAQQHGEMLRNESTCVIVARRGDYALEELCHPMLTAEYYAHAISMFPPETAFIVTSDDIPWCRDNIRARKITYLPQDEWWLNFFIGTMCRHAIISNTTFGWWIAWLNADRHRRVIAPRRWFGPELAHHDTGDLFPREWTIV